MIDVNRIGRAVGVAIDAGRPMGSWTGLPPAIGAPLSGALWGAGAGALTGLILRLRDEKKRRSSLLTPTLIGGLAGLGLGTYSAAMRNHYKPASFQDDAAAAIRRDRALTAAQSAQVEHAFRMASPYDQRRLATMLATGTSAAVIARMLGINLMGSVILGGGVGWAAANFLTPKKRHFV
jgi:uncharacterized membrane protein YebE (DUF533 family)